MHRRIFAMLIAVGPRIQLSSLRRLPGKTYKPAALNLRSRITRRWHGKASGFERFGACALRDEQLRAKDPPFLTLNPKLFQARNQYVGLDPASS